MILETSRQMLMRIGFTASAANDLYQRQDIDFINDWAHFDKDVIFSMLHSVRKPVGGGNCETVGF